MLRLHNETVNVWTHLLGFLYFVGALVLLLLSPPPGPTSSWLCPLSIQLLSYQLCMLSSATFHLVSCHSEAAHFRFRAFDHAGIVVALYGTLVVFIDEVFHCHPVSLNTLLYSMS